MTGLELTTEEQKIVDDFSLFEDWTDKYEYIIELGKKLPVLEDIHKTDENRIKGCQSNVWLVAEANEGNVVFKADSDSVIVKGLVSLLVRVLSGKKPQEILDCELGFIDAVGLTQHLAPTRSNGLLAMVKQMKNYALAFKIKLQN